jgi:hypothetical protein
MTAIARRIRVSPDEREAVAPRERPRVVTNVPPDAVVDELEHKDADLAGHTGVKASSAPQRADAGVGFVVPDSRAPCARTHPSRSVA